MNRKQALAIAIDALQKLSRQWLYASDSDASDKKRVEIARAIELLDSMRRQKELW